LCFFRKMVALQNINLSMSGLTYSLWEMIFVQPFSNNFLTIFSLILALSSYSLSSFFSLYYFWPIKRERIKVVVKVVPKSCTNITFIMSEVIINNISFSWHYKKIQKLILFGCDNMYVLIILILFGSTINTCFSGTLAV
jgi:hypothetical protein